MTTLRTEPKSKLGISLQMYRADRPDEWAMDDFTRLAEKMQSRIVELEKALSNIKKHQEAVIVGMPQLSTTWQIASRALEK